MNIIELTYSVEKTGLRIPIEDLRQMGLTPNDEITVAFLSHNGEKNDFREFVLYGAGKEQCIQIPNELLMQAAISAEDDVHILCLNGSILIARSETLYPEELPEVLAKVRIANGIAAQLSDTSNAASRELAEALDKCVEGAFRE